MVYDNSGLSYQNELTMLIKNDNNPTVSISSPIYVDVPILYDYAQGSLTQISTIGSKSISSKTFTLFDSRGGRVLDTATNRVNLVLFSSNYPQSTIALDNPPSSYTNVIAVNGNITIPELSISSLNFSRHGADIIDYRIISLSTTSIYEQVVVRQILSTVKIVQQPMSIKSRGISSYNARLIAFSLYDQYGQHMFNALNLYPFFVTITIQNNDPTLSAYDKELVSDYTRSYSGYADNVFFLQNVYLPAVISSNLTFIVKVVAGPITIVTRSNNFALTKPLLSKVMFDETGSYKIIQLKSGLTSLFFILYDQDDQPYEFRDVIANITVEGKTNKNLISSSTNMQYRGSGGACIIEHIEFDPRILDELASVNSLRLIVSVASLATPFLISTATSSNIMFLEVPATIRATPQTSLNDYYLQDIRAGDYTTITASNIYHIFLIAFFLYCSLVLFSNRTSTLALKYNFDGIVCTVCVYIFFVVDIYNQFGDALRSFSSPCDLTLTVFVGIYQQTPTLVYNTTIRATLGDNIFRNVGPFTYFGSNVLQISCADSDVQSPQYYLNVVQSEVTSFKLDESSPGVFYSSVQQQSYNRKDQLLPVKLLLFDQFGRTVDDYPVPVLPNPDLRTVKPRIYMFRFILPSSHILALPIHRRSVPTNISYLAVTAGSYVILNNITLSKSSLNVTLTPYIEVFDISTYHPSLPSTDLYGNVLLPTTTSFLPSFNMKSLLTQFVYPVPPTSGDFDEPPFPTCYYKHEDAYTPVFACLILPFSIRALDQYNTVIPNTTAKYDITMRMNSVNTTVMQHSDALLERAQTYYRVFNNTYSDYVFDDVVTPYFPHVEWYYVLHITITTADSVTGQTISLTSQRFSLYSPPVPSTAVPTTMSPTSISPTTVPPSTITPSSSLPSTSSSSPNDVTTVSPSIDAGISISIVVVIDIIIGSKYYNNIQTGEINFALLVHMIQGILNIPTTRLIIDKAKSRMNMLTLYITPSNVNSPDSSSVIANQLLLAMSSLSSTPTSISPSLSPSYTQLKNEGLAVHKISNVDTNSVPPSETVAPFTAATSSSSSSPITTIIIVVAVVVFLVIVLSIICYKRCSRAAPHKGLGGLKKQESITCRTIELNPLAAI